MPTRQEWLLRFIAGTEGYDGWIDRIRLMKGMFLFQEENVPPPEVNYRFQPYDYGPFTAELYRDLDDLQDKGLVVPTADAKSYRLSERGKQHLAALSFSENQVARLTEIRVEVCDLGFRNLLRRVYKAHPDSASRSVAKDVLN